MTVRLYFQLRNNKFSSKVHQKRTFRLTKRRTNIRHAQRRRASRILKFHCDLFCFFELWFKMHYFDFVWQDQNSFKLETEKLYVEMCACVCWNCTWNVCVANILEIRLWKPHLECLLKQKNFKLRSLLCCPPVNPSNAFDPWMPLSAIVSRFHLESKSKPRARSLPWLSYDILLPVNQGRKSV